MALQILIFEFCRISFDSNLLGSYLLFQFVLQKHPHKMGFGRVTKYWRISLKDIRSTSFLNNIARAAQESGEAEHLMTDARAVGDNGDETLIRAWDESIELASGKYRYEDHNLLANNCHDHVSEALRRINFKGTTRWNTVTLTVYLMLYGKFVRYETFPSFQGSSVCCQILYLLFSF